MAYLPTYPRYSSAALLDLVIALILYNNKIDVKHSWDFMNDSRQANKTYEFVLLAKYTKYYIYMYENECTMQ